MKNKKITNINVLFYQLWQLWQLWHVQVHLWQLQQLWHVHWTLNIIQVHLWHPGYPQAAGGKDRTVSNSIKDDTTWNINWNHTHQPTHLPIDRILSEIKPTAGDYFETGSTIGKPRSFTPPALTPMLAFLSKSAAQRWYFDVPCLSVIWVLSHPNINTKII